MWCMLMLYHSNSVSRAQYTTDDIVHSGLYDNPLELAAFFVVAAAGRVAWPLQDRKVCFI